MTQRKSWIIGGKPACDIVVDQSIVSGRHCRLTRTDDEFVLEDLASRNGTFVNGVRIEGPIKVTEADTITLGRSVQMPWPEGPQDSSDDVVQKSRRGKDGESPDGAEQDSKSAEEEPSLAHRASVEETPGPRAIGGGLDSDSPLPEGEGTSGSSLPKGEKGEGTVVEGEGTETIRIGRLADNDVVLDYPIVSGHHAQIVFEQGQAWLEDCDSRNGTAIGSPEQKIQRAQLTQDDVVYFGTLRVPAARLLAGGLGMGDRPFTTVKVATQQVILGRAKGCDVVLDDPAVSRRHARLVRSDRKVTIEDLRSSHGTFVNGQRISTPHSIRPGDLVAIGRFTLKLTADGNLEQRDFRGNVAIEARGVTVDVPKRRLLEDVSLTIYASELVALMGPSGAGKTTLLNALNGYTPPSAGNVLFDGRDLYAHYAEFQGVVGYVPEDDIMHRELTVGQALYYTARLRLPDDFSEDEIQKRTQEVISQLGLRGTEDVLIGSPDKQGISGGQRKRVNLAMELLTDPPVLLLDEPTSGLSSEDALMVMKLLRRLADSGKTIVVTIHQPSLEAYRLVDNLILVSKDAGSLEPGRLAYYGPAYPQAIDFFNPDGVVDLQPEAEPSPDEVLRGLAKDKTVAWVERYEASPQKRQFVTDRAGKQPVEHGQSVDEDTYRAFGFDQWRTLVRRCLAIKLRDTTNTAILMAQAPVIALLVVLVFGKQTSEAVTPGNWHSVASATSITVFLLALAALWFGCSNAAREIVGERAIYRRERMVNLKIPSFIGSKFAVLGTLCFIQCTVLLVIVHWGGGLRGPWLAMFFILLLTSLVGLGLGLTISSLARTSEVAIALLPLVLLPLVILAGILQPAHRMSAPAKLLAQVMPSRWAFEGLLLLEVEDRPLWTPPASTSDHVTTSSAAVSASRSNGIASESVVADSLLTEAEPPRPHDMAEQYFPRESERMGTIASGMALVTMLAGLVAAICVILRSRDLH